MKRTSHTISHYKKWTLLSIICGLLAGIATSAFLWALDWATQTRQATPELIVALPFAGALVIWVQGKWGKGVSKGNNLILEEIHDPKQVLPARMSPLIFFGTVVTHLFGGSAGREGTAVQMSASLSDQLSRWIPIEKEERKILLTASTGAGFGAALGAPWAGVLFGMEVVRVGRLRPFAVVESIIASFTAYYTTLLLKAPHTHYKMISSVDFDFYTLGVVAVAGVAFGLAALSFVTLTHSIETLLQKIKHAPLRPFISGCVLVLSFYLLKSDRYAGLGIPVIRESLTQISSWVDPVLKTIFTSLTVGSGFKGGEFIPLVFIGSTLGSALSAVLPVSFSLLAAIGFAAVFAGASNTPLACAIMAIELFGFPLAPYAFVACYMSYYFSGERSIYSAQRTDHPKSVWRRWKAYLKI